ncbi:MAG: molybdopterin-guanine dinucleotide biosynthesis protein B [Euryarchaeota archaeon]|nr:molybdopterin-guanine dinucleotide biosynthesis protein B [Euryarchaeota archaeon]
MNSAAVIGIVGYHNTGKTTLVCRLIERLAESGYSISTIKNIPKEDFFMDIQGTDTWKHGESGAKIVVASSPDETSFIVKNALKFDEIIRIVDLAASPDLILVEGHKSENIPKIVLGDLHIDGDRRRYDPDTDNFEDILNYITEMIEINRIYNKLPKINCGKCGYSDCMGMAEAIFRNEKTLADCVIHKGYVSATVGGKDVPMGPFVQDIMSKTIAGMISSLKGVGYADIDADIVIKIRHEHDR